MTDTIFLAPAEAFVLDPPVGVPAPAPLEMPRRTIRLFPVDFRRLLPRSVPVGNTAQDSHRA